MIDCTSSFQPAQISATATGCVMYGSPLWRYWPRCASSEKWKASFTSLMSAGFRYDSFSVSPAMETTCWRGGAAGCEVGPNKCRYVCSSTASMKRVSPAGGSALAAAGADASAPCGTALGDRGGSAARSPTRSAPCGSGRFGAPVRGDAEPEAEVGMEANEAEAAPGKDAAGAAAPVG